MAHPGHTDWYTSRHFFLQQQVSIDLGRVAIYSKLKSLLTGILMGPDRLAHFFKLKFEDEKTNMAIPSTQISTWCGLKKG